MFVVDRVPRKDRPLILLPTTAGRGGEVLRTAVASERHVKRSIICYNIASDIAIVDPELTVGSPHKVTAYTGLDTLTHSIEGIMSVVSNPW